MAERSEHAPHIRDEFSDLQTLAMRALRMYGDQAPESADASVLLMFVDFGNEIVEEVRQHPYWTGDIAYYKAATSTTNVPDAIILRGLLSKYAQQQASDRAQMFTQTFHRTMNQVLWNRKNGNKPIEMQPVDGGSRPLDANEQGNLNAEQLRSLANNGQ